MKEEKITIILEQLLKSIEELKAKKDTSENQTKFESLTNELKRLDGIEEYQVLFNQNLANTNKNIRFLRKEIKNFEPVNTTIHHHDHVFFPGLLSWLEGVKRAKIIIGLVTLLSISFISIFFINQSRIENEEISNYYKMGHYKYFASLKLNHSLDKVEKRYNQNKQLLIHEVDSAIRHQNLLERTNKNLEYYYKKAVKYKSKRDSLERQ